MRLDQPIIRLPLQTDTATLVAELQTIPEDAWRPHPEGMPGNSALPLVAVMGNPDNDSVEGPMRPTPILESLPSIVNIMAGLTGLGCPIGRSRLMRIDIESEVISHVDTNRYWWDHLRVHFPIVTDPSVMFHVEDTSVHMEPGNCWVFDTWRPHRVENPTNAPRIHLVIDTVGGAGFWSLIDRQTGMNYADSALPQVQPVAAIAFESMNQPLVMPAAEIDRTLAQILHQLAEVDLERATEIDRALLPFRRSWRACWAHFGENPEGFAAFQRLRDDANNAIQSASDVLPNGVEVHEAIRQLVIRPGLSNTAVAALGAGSETASKTPSPITAVPTDIAADAPPMTAPPSASASVATSPIPARAQSIAAEPAEPVTLDRPVFIISSPRSGSTMLFEALLRAKESYTIGGESHQLIEAFPSLTPAAHQWESNRLTADDISSDIVEKLSGSFVRRLRDRDGNPVTPGSVVRMIEKTPKNSLRIPFLAAAYPDAKFVYLWRDPRETISSMLDAWRSGRFITYPDLPDWTGDRWSLLLTPGWKKLIGKSLPEIVADQWVTATTTMLDDLEALEPERWCVTSYSALLADPDGELTSLCATLDLTWDTTTDGDLPLSATTLEAPQRSKWERNAAEMKKVWGIVDPVAVRAHDVFADPPTIQPSRSRSADAVKVELGEEPDGAIPTDFSSVFTQSFGKILEAANASLAITTYQSGRVVFVRRDGEKVNTHLRYFSSPMGIAVQGAKLALGTKTTVWEFWNQQAAAKSIDPEGKVDACYMPRRGHTTGDIRIHDLAYDADGELWAVATRFSCLVTFDRESSFTPRWRPQFISGLSADDRCHLNGLAMVDGRPKYVSVLGMTDSPNGWRDDKAAGGAILDIDGGAPITVGLSMPHSPRWHNGKLWVLESGRGALCTVDIETGQVETVAVLPGFTRGLSFVGNLAFIGLSKVRETVFDGLPITQADIPRECGVWVVDLNTGSTVAFLRFEGSVTELFEVAVLPGVMFPELVEPGAEAANDAFVLSDEALKDVIT
ncbi:MAG: TIGR03032 family protein [Actinomycetes bacterium]